MGIPVFVDYRGIQAIPEAALVGTPDTVDRESRVTAVSVDSQDIQDSPLLLQVLQVSQDTAASADYLVTQDTVAYQVTLGSAELELLDSVDTADFAGYPDTAVFQVLSRHIHRNTSSEPA